MTYYIRIDNKEDLEWLKKLISNSLSLDPNNEKLITNYQHLFNWNRYLSEPVPMKTVNAVVQDAKAILTEIDLKKVAPKPAVRGRPPSKKNKAKKKPVVQDIDPYQCPIHKTYGAKRRPQGDCEKCWELYKVFNPLKFKQARLDYERSLQKKTAK